jgi:ADP-heptose:LPS heptosyltransferase
VERQAEQLRMAGIEAFPEPVLDWLDADVARFDLPEPFCLLAPGGARHRPDKRWPAARYAALASALVETGVRPALLGTTEEAPLMAEVRAACADAVDLTGRTTLLEVAGLARRARLAVGNDTGPLHLTAAVGCPTVVLYSHASNPALCGQRGRAVTILRKPSLAELAVDDVLAALP